MPNFFVMVIVSSVTTFPINEATAIEAKTTALISAVDVNIGASSRTVPLHVAEVFVLLFTKLATLAIVLSLSS